jgi:VWFA-related protein
MSRAFLGLNRWKGWEAVVLGFPEKELKALKSGGSEMKKRAGWLVIWSFVGLAFGSKSLSAQQEPATDFFDTVDVNVVNVEVYVSDKKGNPVAGLRQEDFEVLVDGEPIKVSNFYAARGKGALEATAPQEDLEAAPEPAAPAAQLQVHVPKPPDQRLNLVIFIDNVNLSPRTRNRVLEDLRGSLFFNLNPDDQVMLVSYDGSINIRHGLTNDVEDLMEAIEEVAQGSPRGLLAGLDRASILRELQQTDIEQAAAAQAGGFGEDTIDWGGILRSIQAYAAERHLNNKRTIENIQSFVDVLSGTVGRKALIYVSDGLELRPGEALFQAWDDKRRSSGGEIGSFVNIESEAREFDTTGLFEELGKRANSNQVTFYTILAGGGQSHTASPAERSAFFSFNAPSTLGQVWSERFEAIEASNFRGSMQILAEATGGISTLNAAAFGVALKRLKRDLDTFYSLGFEAEDDTEDHRIKVRVKNSKLRLRYRESYRNKTPDERMSDLTLSALLLESEDNPLQVVVGFGEDIQDEKGRYLVPIMVKFPISSLLLLPQEKYHEGRVSIYVGARDQEGGLSPVQKMPAPIRIPNDKLLTALGQVAGFRLTLLLNPGEHAVAVGVRDELANVESTTTVLHTPGTAEAGL